MGKMHELLAVESTLIGNYNRDTQETIKVFDKPDQFQRNVTKKEHFNDEDSHLNTVETKEMTTTVKDRLDWYRKSATNLFDAILQKDATNQLASADVIVEGRTLLTGVPATTLLMLESKLQDLRKVYASAPTISAAVAWEWDTNENLWKTKDPMVAFSTKKTAKAVVLYEATKEHPAQVKEVFEDVPIAKVTKEAFSGMWTSAEKALVLGRLDKLLAAVKKARQRANEQEVVERHIGDYIFDYLHADVVV